MINLDQNLKALVVCICFVIGVFILEWVFYGEAIVSPINNAQFTGGILDVLTILWSFIYILFNMITLNLPDFPLVLRLVIMLPFWGAMIYIMLPILAKISELIIDGIDAIIPF